MVNFKNAPKRLVTRGPDTNCIHCQDFAIHCQGRAIHCQGPIKSLKSPEMSHGKCFHKSSMKTSVETSVETSVGHEPQTPHYRDPTRTTPPERPHQKDPTRTTPPQRPHHNDPTTATPPQRPHHSQRKPAPFLRCRLPTISQWAKDLFWVIKKTCFFFSPNGGV